MRNISDALNAHLASGSTTICRCWKISREDGVVLGFSDHDTILGFDGVSFEANSSLDAKALQSAVGLSVDNTEAAGAISSDGITDEDISAGRYDNAEVSIWIVNWMEPEQRYLTFKGFLGEITHGQNSFTAELRSLSDKLNRPVGRTFLKQCSASLGDTSCKFAVEGENYTKEFKVKRMDGFGLLYLDPASAFENDWFTFGVAKFVGGKNDGKRAGIHSDRVVNSERRVELIEHLQFEVAENDVVILTVGCDKQAGTCTSKFDNIINYQGFPHIPGEDWSLSYPTSSNAVSGD